MRKNPAYLYTILLSLIIISFVTCKKDKCPAGEGGNLTLKLKTIHHNNYIYGCLVKIKFGTQDFPGATGAFDLTKQAGAHDSTITFSGLKCGDYYIYGTGVDSSLTSTDKSVSGGIPYSTTKDDGVVELTLPVTEDH